MITESQLNDHIRRFSDSFFCKAECLFENKSVPKVKDHMIRNHSLNEEMPIRLTCLQYITKQNALNTRPSTVFQQINNVQVSNQVNQHSSASHILEPPVSVESAITPEVPSLVNTYHPNTANLDTTEFIRWLNENHY